MPLPAVLLNKTERLSMQAVRYMFVGAIAFVADFTVLVGLTEVVGWHYLASAAAGFSVGLATSYLLAVRWVFSHRNLADKRVEFLVFALVGVVGLVMTEGILWFGQERLGIDYRLVKFGAVALVFGWNFLARKALLFRNLNPESAVVLPTSNEGPR
jgi:putative flippase GtrA